MSVARLLSAVLGLIALGGESVFWIASDTSE
jgi:hypothetical protein